MDGSVPADANTRAATSSHSAGPEVRTSARYPRRRPARDRSGRESTAAGLNPMDWFMTSDAQTAARFGLSLPSGSGPTMPGSWTRPVTA